MTEDSNLLLDEINPDGAILEGLDAMEAHSTRAEFLKKFAVGASGLAIAGALVSPAGALAAGGNGKVRSLEQDIDILNYALTLEYLEQSFYIQAYNAKKLNKVNTHFAKVVGTHETAHVKAIYATIKSLGGKPVARPTFNFHRTNASDGVFMKTSLALEETGVAAYLGQIERINNYKVLIAAGKIATVEARHASWIRSIIGINPAPKAFDGTRNMTKTLAVVKGTKFILKG